MLRRDSQALGEGKQVIIGRGLRAGQGFTFHILHKLGRLRQPARQAYAIRQRLPVALLPSRTMAAAGALVRISSWGRGKARAVLMRQPRRMVRRKYPTLSWLAPL